MPLLKLKLLPIIFLAAITSGCHYFKTQTQPATQIPFNFPDNWETASSAQKISLGWLSQFNDTVLNQHVRTALQNNFDLQVSAERLAAAIASAKAINSSLYPELNLGLQRNRQKAFLIDSQGLVSTEYSTQYRGDVNLTWEIDLWGKLSDRSRSAYLDSQVQAALYESARLSLAATVAQTWFNSIEAVNLLSLAQKQLKSLNEALDVVENNYQAGLTSAVDVFSARSDLENQKAVVAQSQQNLEQIKRSFNVLLGRYPSAVLELEESKLPTEYLPTPVGLPSELLLRRPDIIAARLNWLSKDYGQQAAQKDRYPSFTLTGNIGQSSEQLSELLDSDDLFWSLVTGLSQPVFNAGRLKALEENAAAQTRQALAEYANTLLTAFSEVENALAAENYLLTRYKTTKQAAELAEAAYQLSLEQYQSGLIEYVTVLTAQRQFFAADSNQISLYNDLIQNRIALHLALGGNFFNQPDNES